MNADSALASRTTAKVARRILPFLLLLYIVAFLDRVNVAYAALEMTQDLGFSDHMIVFQDQQASMRQRREFIEECPEHWFQERFATATPI